MSHEYGWETEYILSRTFREIEYRLYAIDRRKKIELSNAMAMKGVKSTVAIPKRRISKEVSEELKELDKDVEARVQKAFEERKRLWQEKS